MAAIASNGTLASFSNYGATTVDLGAPGVGVCSTLPGNTYALLQRHVDGDAARHRRRRPVRLAHPGATAAQIKNAILSSATATASLSGKTATGGRLNIGAWIIGSAEVGRRRRRVVRLRLDRVPAELGGRLGIDSCGRCL